MNIPERINQFNQLTGYTLRPDADYDLETIHMLNCVEFEKLVSAARNCRDLNQASEYWKRIEAIKNQYNGDIPHHHGASALYK